MSPRPSSRNRPAAASARGAAKRRPGGRKAAADAPAPAPQKPTGPYVAPSIPAPVLTGAQRRHLRGLGHDLDPVVRLGHGGIDDGVLRAIDAALLQHELIKIKVGRDGMAERHDDAALLAEATASAQVQVLGGTILLFRPHPQKPVIKLPRTRPVPTAEH